MIENRIAVLDLLRGAAVLGILLMNIRLFSEPYAAYFNPLIFGQFTGAEQFWWSVQYFVADQKFMCIFSMLFGASTALICDRLEAKNQQPTIRYGKRLVILLAIGLVHSYLIWHGDILVFYALCGVIPLLLRKFEPRLLLTFGLLLLIVGSVKSYATYVNLAQLPQAVMPDIIQAHFTHSVAFNRSEIEGFSGNWLSQLSTRVDLALHFQTDTFFAWGFWRVSGLMLIGMALYRWGMFTGRHTSKFYFIAGLVSLAIGFALVTVGFIHNMQSHWRFPDFFLKDMLWNYWGSILVALGYVCTLTLFHRHVPLSRLYFVLQSVGRTALSNYLLQSVLCTLFFYGLGQFSNLSRSQAMLVVLVVWTTQIGLTLLWLRHYSAGPIEKLWRYLTQKKWFFNDQIQKI